MIGDQINIIFQLLRRKGMEHTFSNRNPFAVVFTVINPTLCLVINMGSTTTELQATNMVCWKGVDGPRSILDMNHVAGCIVETWALVQ
jgi:hypothetical protein